MRLLRPLLLGSAVVLLAGAEPKSRSFLLTYEAAIKDVPAGKKARIWLPVPPSDREQDVSIVKRDLPATEKINTEPRHHNKVLHLEARAGATGVIALAVTYQVKRREARETPLGEGDSEEDLARYLQADRRVPVGGKPAQLLQGRSLPGDSLQLGHTLFDLVNDHMRYSKEGTGWGEGDAVWACDSRRGNCTDFHSLFISLARTQKLPARFVIGFALPSKRGSGAIAGYHCWAYFKPKDHGWVPVDISEANKDPRHKEEYFGKLTENRVAFSTGRDLVLVPRQDGPPLNFFIYPHVEVDGKPYPREKVELRVRFADQ